MKATVSERAKAILAGRLCPPKSILAPNSNACKQDIACLWGPDEIKMTSQWIREISKLMTKCPYRKVGEIGKHTGRRQKQRLE